VFFNGALLLFCSSCNRSSNSSGDTNNAAYERIVKSGEIKVGYISYPPGFIKDPNSGIFSGIVNDVFLEVAKNLDLKLVYQEEVTWATLVELVE
jgi:ABC-type amino acid transport substrate-binding protein